MTTAYVPQPGTIAARAVAIVLDLPDGQSIANVVLAEQLGQNASLVNVGMEAPVRHGLVECVRNGRLVSWRRGSGVPRSAPQPLDDEVDDAPIVRRHVPAPKTGGVSLLDVPAWSLPKEATMNKPDVTPPPAQEAARRVGRFRPAGHRAETSTAAPGDHRRGLALPSAAGAHEGGRLHRRGAGDRQGARVGREEGQGEAGHARAQRDGHRRLEALT